MNFYLPKAESAFVMAHGGSAYLKDLVRVAMAGPSSSPASPPTPNFADPRYVPRNVVCRECRTIYRGLPACPRCGQRP